MRPHCLLMLAISLLSACGGGGECSGDECIGTPCGPGGECPGGLVCDPVSNTCVRRGATADAGPQLDAPPAIGP